MTTRRLLPCGLLGGVPILTAEPNARWAIRKGFNAPDMEPDGWTPISGSEVEVRLTPAVHAARPMPHRPNAANGHLVRGPSGIVWLAGDTELFDGMEGLRSSPVAPSTSRSCRSAAGVHGCHPDTSAPPKPRSRVASSAPASRSRCTGEPSIRPPSRRGRAAGWTHQGRSSPRRFPRSRLRVSRSSWASASRSPSPPPTAEPLPRASYVVMGGPGSPRRAAPTSRRRRPVRAQRTTPPHHWSRPPGPRPRRAPTPRCRPQSGHCPNVTCTGQDPAGIPGMRACLGGRGVTDD